MQPRLFFVLLISSAIIPSAKAVENSTLPHSDILLTILIIICLIELGIILGLQKSNKLQSKQRQDLTQKYQQLERRLVERTEKLNILNNQLYDEIAKHEVTEELLRESQDYIQNIINSMPSVLIGVTKDFIITHWNKAAQELTGTNYNNALGQPLNKIAPSLDTFSSLIEKAINLNQPQRLQNRQQGHGSQATYSDLTIYPLLSEDIEGAVIRIDDVTLRVRLETMMIQNEKMNSLGELAAGVAHEINNPLGTILQNVQNILRRFSQKLSANKIAANDIGIDLKELNDYLKSRKILNLLNDISEAGERATVIVRNMLEFSRAHNKNIDAVDMRDLLNRAIEMALHFINANQAEKGSKASIKLEAPENSPPVLCASIEIQQVILNLISNAFHAHKDAEIQHRLEILLQLTFSETDVILKIKDNGPGMDEWTRRHIFDPFFTTKEVGKGTGLGLSVSYFIITEHHKGTINVESTAGKGTEFIITLPLTANDLS